jgi:hypothetical protein
MKCRTQPVCTALAPAATLESGGRATPNARRRCERPTLGGVVGRATSIPSVAQ